MPDPQNRSQMPDLPPPGACGPQDAPPGVVFPWSDRWASRRSHMRGRVGGAIGAGAARVTEPLRGAGFERNTIFRGFLWALAAFVSVQMLGLGILLAFYADPNDYQETLAALIVTLVVDLVALVAVPVWILGGWRRGIAALGLRKPDLTVVGWGVLGLALSYAALGAYLGMVSALGIDALEPVSTIDDDVIYENIELVILTGVLAVGMAPIAEEIFYRGFLIGGLARRWSLGVGMAGSSLLFAAVHLDAGSLIPFALIGFVFAWVALRSRSLYAAILAHFLFNLIAYSATVADRGVG